MRGSCSSAETTAGVRCARLAEACVWRRSGQDPGLAWLSPPLGSITGLAHSMPGPVRSCTGCGGDHLVGLGPKKATGCPYPELSSGFEVTYSTWLLRLANANTLNRVTCLSFSGTGVPGLLFRRWLRLSSRQRGGHDKCRNPPPRFIRSSLSVDR